MHTYFELNEQHKYLELFSYTLIKTAKIDKIAHDFPSYINSVQYDSFRCRHLQCRHMKPEGWNPIPE